MRGILLFCRGGSSFFSVSVGGAVYGCLSGVYGTVLILCCVGHHVLVRLVSVSMVGGVRLSVRSLRVDRLSRLTTIMSFVVLRVLILFHLFLVGFEHCVFFCFTLSGGYQAVLRVVSRMGVWDRTFGRLLFGVHFFLLRFLQAYRFYWF